MDIAGMIEAIDQEIQRLQEAKALLAGIDIVDEAAAREASSKRQGQDERSRAGKDRGGAAGPVGEGKDGREVMPRKKRFRPLALETMTGALT